MAPNSMSGLRKNKLTAAFTVMGLETSCDETAVAIVRGTPGKAGEILSHVILSQMSAHQPYGGVVPEIAARAHVEVLDDLIRRAIDDAKEALANDGFDALDGIAATAGPGLIGGVMVGLVSGKALAIAHELPFIAVNHLEGHALTARLCTEIDFPFLLLLVSGGHTQLLAVKGVGDYERLGTTLDDALGEAYDKTAKLLGLGFPGGPAVEKQARQGNQKRFDFPRPLRGREGFDFSFSGLKTAVRQTVEAAPHLSMQDKADICASFQLAACEALCARTQKAMTYFKTFVSAQVKPSLVVAGGVAANIFLRHALEKLAAQEGYELVCPPIHLCTDNGAMIAWAGIERLALGLTDDLNAVARARWPL